MHSKSVLPYKQGANEGIAKYKAKLVACRNEEYDYQENSFSLVTYFRILKPVLCTLEQRE